MARVTKVRFGPTEEVGELTAVAALERNPIGAVQLTLLHVFGLRLAAAAQQLFGVEPGARLLTRITAGEVRLFAFVAHEKQVLVQGEGRWVVVVRTVGLQNLRVCLTITSGM